MYRRMRVVTPRRSVALALGEVAERRHVGEDESILLLADQPVLEPAAHDADRRLDGRARHVRQALPREMEGQGHSARSVRALALREPEQRGSEAGLDGIGG